MIPDSLAILLVEEKNKPRHVVMIPATSMRVMIR